jgi:hypothetical protein
MGETYGAEVEEEHGPEVCWGAPVVFGHSTEGLPQLAGKARSVIIVRCARLGCRDNGPRSLTIEARGGLICTLISFEYLGFEGLRTYQEIVEARAWPPFRRRL